MRLFCSLLFAIFSLTLVTAQLYTPKHGETVLKLEIEGRGNVYILLHTKEAPKTTAHILALARQGFYNAQRFYRVVRIPKPYLVQIGDPTSKTGDIETVGGDGGSGVRVPFEETPFKNIVGAVGLARNSDDKDSGDSQFYVLLDKARFLDGNYSVFGQVVVGLDVIKKIQKGDRVVSVAVLTGQ